jgi:hypothetical protein
MPKQHAAVTDPSGAAVRGTVRVRLGIQLVRRFEQLMS